MPEECLPETLEIEGVYNFLKKGLRNYWILGEIPLRETKGNENLSKPIASIKILEVTHFLKDGEIWTKGKYKVIETNNFAFDGYEKIKGD
ncbi:MAG: hypothetical protein ACP5D2_04010 [Candidatus Nanoarchaeia archaeon]